MDNGHATTTAPASGPASGPGTAPGTTLPAPPAPSDPSVARHIGPSEDEVRDMLDSLGFQSLDQLADVTVPESIRLRRPLKLGPARGEHELLRELRDIA